MGSVAAEARRADRIAQVNPLHYLYSLRVLASRRRHFRAVRLLTKAINRRADLVGAGVAQLDLFS